jgi:WD40 repeat protein
MTGELPYATAVAFSPDVRLLAIGWSIHPDVKPEPPYGQITMVDVQTGKPVRAPLDVAGWIWQVQFDATGRKLIVADGVTPVKLPQQSGAAHILDWRSGAALRTVHVKDPRCRAAALTPFGDVLVTASENGLASWDVASGDLLAQHHSKGGRNFVHLMGNGARLITGNGASVEIRDLTSLEVLQTYHQRRDMSPPGVTPIVGDVALHPSGRTLVSGSWNGTLTVWDVESGQPMLTMPAHPTGIHRLDFSPDGRTLFSAGHDGKVRSWSAD